MHIRWECSQRKSFSCKGSVTTDITIENVMNSTSHHHADDDVKVQASKVKATMKDYATAIRGKPSQILADTAVAVSVEVRAALGDTESVKRTI